MEITKFAKQMTCFIGHVIYSWIFLEAGWDFLSHSPLRTGGHSMARTSKSPLTKHSSKTLAMHHFGQFGAYSRAT